MAGRRPRASTQRWRRTIPTLWWLLTQTPWSHRISSGPSSAFKIYEQGIEINWSYNSYNLEIVTVSMIIRPPSTPPPPREPSTRVTDIDLTTIKRQVAATVRVQNDLDWNVVGASVTATWVFPDGHTELVTSTTDGFGTVRFTIDKARRGTYTFTIEDVILDGYPFDRDNSVLSASITKSK